MAGSRWKLRHIPRRLAGFFKCQRLVVIAIVQSMGDCDEARSSACNHTGIELVYLRRFSWSLLVLSAIRLQRRHRQIGAVAQRHRLHSFGAYCQRRRALRSDELGLARLEIKWPP